MLIRSKKMLLTIKCFVLLSMSWFTNFATVSGNVQTPCNNDLGKLVIKVEKKFNELGAEIRDLRAKIEKKCSLVRKIENGVLEVKDKKCYLRCTTGAYAVPAETFPCNESKVCVDGGIKCLAAGSCSEILKYRPNAESGIYSIFSKKDKAPYNVYCDMTTDNGGWTLAAVIANGDKNNWVFGDADRDFGDSSSLWENEKTLGAANNATASIPKDFKSKAFIELQAEELLISFKGRSYIQTNNKCLGGFSLKRLFNILRFSCSGSSYNCYYGKCLGTGGQAISTRCDHSCDIAKFYRPPVSTKEPLSNGILPTKVLIKTGEAEGAQDGNKDRVYISTLPFRNNVDYVNGLGAFTRLISGVKKADISIRDDVSKESDDRSLFYGLLVR